MAAGTEYIIKIPRVEFTCVPEEIITIFIGNSVGRELDLKLINYCDLIYIKLRKAANVKIVFIHFRRVIKRSKRK